MAIDYLVGVYGTGVGFLPIQPPPPGCVATSLGTLHSIGSDLGVAINAANAALGSNKGVILVAHGDYTMSTPIILSDNRHLHFGHGLINNEVPSLPSAAIYYGDNTTISGEGTGSIIRQSRYASYPSNTTGFVIFASAKSRTNGALKGSTNVIFRDLAVTYHPLAATNNSINSAIELGNSDTVLLENVYFEQLGSFGLTIGGSGDSGFYARNIRVLSCVFNQSALEEIAVVNADGFTISQCEFICKQWQAAIDCEPNDVNDRLVNFIIDNNRFDHRISPGGGGDIQIYGGEPYTGHGRLSNNLHLGGDVWAGSPTYYGTSAYSINGPQDVDVVGNRIRGYLQGAILVGDHAGVSNYSFRCNISDNDIIDGGVNPSIFLGKAVHCTVQNNRIWGTASTGGSEVSIIESAGVSDYNIVRGNMIFANDPTKPTITLTGAHSVKYDNIVQGTRDTA